MGVVVVNISEGEKDGVYIGRGRGSEFGNPFVIGIDGNRDEVVEKYREYFLERVATDPEFRRKVWELDGKKLICYCSPRRCHGDILKWWIEGEMETGE